MREQIADLEYYPDCDLPFGKVIMMAMPTVIYQRALEAGYQAGIQAHRDHLKQTGDTEALTDRDFTTIIDRYLPEGLTPDNETLWRSYFIVGWTCITLEIAPFTQEV